MRSIPVIIVAIALAAVVLTGCSKEDPVGPVEMEEVGKVKIPANSMGFVSTKSLQDLAGLSGDLAGSIGKQAAADDGRLADLIRRKMIGTKDLGWMSRTRPMKALVLDPAKFGKPFVMMAPIESKKALMGGLEGVKKDVDGNDVLFTDPEGKTRYINFVGKNAVFTTDPVAFAAAKEFVEGDLLRYPATRALDVQTTAKSAINIVKPLAALGMSRVLKQFPQVGIMTAMGVQKTVEFLDDLDGIRIIAFFENGNLIIESSAVPLEGSAMARAAAGAKDRKLTLAAMAPGDGWLEIAGNADPDETGKSIETLLNSAVAVMGLSSETKDVYPDLLKDLVTSMSGESLVWIGWEKEFPLRTLVIAGLSSPETAKTASAQMFSLLFGEFGKKARVLVPKIPGTDAGAAAAGATQPDPGAQAAPMADLSKLDWTSLENLIASSTDMLSSSGVAVALKKDDTEGAEVNHLDFMIDRARLSASRPDIAKYRNFLDDRLSIGAGFDDRNFYLAAGSDSVRDIQATRGSPAGAGKLAGLISGAGFDVTWAMRLSLVDAAKVATAGYDKLIYALVPGLASMSTSPELTVVSGARDGRVVVGRLSIPLAGISELRKPGQPAPAP